VLAIIDARGDDVWVQGIKESCAILQGAQKQGPWLDPRIDLTWPPFFAETAQDRQFRVAYTVSAEQGRLISRATAIQHLGAVFGVSDVAAEEEAIEEQRDEDNKAEVAALPPQPGAGEEKEQPAPEGEGEAGA
jgi:hypothetical protein